ncbi:PucR family transcriptional regulator [Mycobacterium adipatum]|uniref:PucR family transcriptional regulator n=1 Tax=Mycobacterium adipatum TaxID=1682113 RepID=UPI0034E0C999
MPRPSERTRQLLRAIAETLVQSPGDWLDELFANSLNAAGLETAAADPVLRVSAERAFQASVLHWVTQNLRNPGARVEPDLGQEVIHITRDLIRRGLEDVATAAYRAGHAPAQRLLVNMAFAVTQEPEELRELLDTATWSIGDYVENTITSVMEMMRAERAAILRDSQPELRETVALVLDGAPITRQRAEERLGYRLDQMHTAVVIWSTEPDTDVRSVDGVSERLGRARTSRPLTVMPGESMKWVWLPGADEIDPEQLRKVVDRYGSVRVAVGSPAAGVEGFRRSHLEAVAAQRMVARLDSAQRVVFFEEVQLVALMTSDLEGAEQFVRQVLGDLAHASSEIRETVLAFVEENGSVQRVAARLYAHRNTVVRRMTRAQDLLPRSLAQNRVQVAAALQVLQWTQPTR